MVIPDYFTMFNQRIWRQEAQGEEPQQQPTPSASTEPQQNAGAQQQTTPRDGSDSSESSLHIVEDYWFGPNSPSRNDQQKSTSQQPPPQLLPYVEDPNAIELENINPQQASGAQLQKTPRDGSDSGESNLEIVKDYVENLPQPPPQLNPNAAEDPIAIELENINPQQTRAGGNQQQQVQEPPKADDGTAINIEVRGFAGTLVLRFLASFCISNTKNRQRRENFAPAQADGGGDDVDGDIAPDLGPPRPPQDLPVKGYIFLCLGVGFGLFLSMLDTTIVATSLYEIGREFDKLDAVNWVALAYTLAFVGCAILFAKVSDVVGRKRAFTAAYVLFVAFSIGCAGANTFTQLLICRAFQGVGGSGLYSLAIIILTEVTPPRWKRFIGTIIGVIIAFAGVLGPILGGVLTNYLSWRWIFWINISGIVAGIVFLFAWPHPEYLPAYQRRSLWQSDVLGSLLLTGAAVLITWAFQNVRAGSGWNDHLFIAPFASGFFCLILLAVWTVIVDNTNLRNRMTTVIPVVLLKNHVYVLMAVSTACLGFGYLMTLYVFPMRFRVVNGYSALEASAMLLPMLGFSALGSMVAPRLSQKRNVLHWTIAAGGMLMTLGTALSAANATSSHRFGTTLYAVYVSLVGLGFGLNAAASTTLSIVESPVYEHATAQGLVALLRIWGGSIGIAVSGAALGTQGTSDIPLSLDLSLEHYTKALETSMIVACAITALGTICAFCARRSRQLSIAYMMQKREEDEAGRQAELAERREAERRKKQQARTDQPQ